MTLEQFMKKHDGVVSVSEFAAHLDVDEHWVRRWARDHDVRRIGPNFAFTLAAARELQAELEEVEAEMEEEDEADLDDEEDECEDEEDEAPAPRRRAR